MNISKDNILPLWSVHEGRGPVFATALHSGHDIREEISRIIALDEDTRFREEDPYTDELAKVSQNRIIPLRSRFEVDLNRSRDKSVYLTPMDAWGLQVWQQKPSMKIIKHSIDEFDEFYATIYKFLHHLEDEYGHFVVFDIHSFNHMRQGPNTLPDDPELNPDVNVGTGTMERQRWENVIDRFIKDLRAFDYLGGHLDVRENVKFVGRELAIWVHTNFPLSGCVLSIEFKKIFMDEWSGTVDKRKLKALYQALKSTLPGISEELQRL